MQMTSRCLSAFCAIAVAGLAACGSSSSGEPVARVAGVGSISKATLDHWIPVEAVVLYQEQPTKPVPRGVIPDPPNYTACIAYLRSNPQEVTATDPKPMTAQLKRKCAEKQQKLKILTLNTLIGWDWTIGAGLARGISVSKREAKRRLAEVNKRTFLKPAAFTNYLKFTGQTLADMLFRTKVQLFEVKLTNARIALEKHPGWTDQQRRQEAAKFQRAMPPSEKWAARTTCRVGYVASGCKQYKGPEAPGLPN
jgi:foldase protein PrsA